MDRCREPHMRRPQRIMPSKTSCCCCRLYAPNFIYAEGLLTNTIWTTWGTNKMSVAHFSPVQSSRLPTPYR